MTTDTQTARFCRLANEIEKEQENIKNSYKRIARLRKILKKLNEKNNAKALDK